MNAYGIMLGYPALMDVALYVLLFAGSLCIYLPIYRYLVARWSSDYVIRSVESGEIDLT